MQQIGMAIQELDTPALLIDLDIMEANIRDMADYCQARGVRLRPHIKTHKIPEIALRQIAAGAVGVAAAKLGEAEVMADAGIADILIANQIIGPYKLQRLIALAKRCRVTVLTDSLDGARQLAEASRQSKTLIYVVVEINLYDPTGAEGRCGVYRDEDAEQIIAFIRDQPYLEFEGISGFRGVPAFFQKQPLHVTQQLVQQTGQEEAHLLVSLARRLRDRGFDVPQVIAGSTPTAKIAAAVPGVTEVHPGEYVFSGGTHVRTGGSAIENCALSVLTTIISRPHPERAIVDGGSKTFAGDINPDLYPNLQLHGYGIITTFQGRYVFPRELPDAKLYSLNEEHGMIRLSSGEAQALKIGDLLRIIPNHVCPVVNLFDTVYAVRNMKVEQVWQIKARGKIT